MPWSPPRPSAARRAVPLLLAGLAAAAAPAAGGAAPPVHLNHFYVVVDAASYRALQASPFLTGAFAPFEKRTTARNDQAYTGIYWYGRRTYFEAFEPESQGPVGSSGIALSVDAPGQSAAVRAGWSAEFGGAESVPVTRRTETGEPVWFHMTYAKAAWGLRLWLMEYDEAFLASWYPESTAARGTTRAELLDRYVAKIGRSAERETAVLRDVVGLALGLDAADRDVLRRHLTAVGWTARDGAAGLTLLGPEGVELQVLPASDGRRGILEARFSVQGRAEPRSESLGVARLQVEPDQARLRFVR